MSAVAKLDGPPSPAVQTTPLALAQRGDAAAVESIYQSHAAAVVRRLYRLCGDREVAQDLTQDAFIIALHRLDTLQDEQALEPWLHGIAFNVLRQHRRAHTRRRGLWQRWRSKPVTPSPALGTAGAPDDEAQLLRTLDTALQGLDADKRDAFVLRQLEGLPLKEAAALLEVSVQTVSYRAKQAEAHVRAAFEGPTPS